MKQFTSHLDFSLTKKRFSVMNRKPSLARRVIRLVPLLPAFLFITFLFCEQKPESDKLYTDVKLQLKQSAYEQVRAEGNFDDDRMYDMNGNLFTGTLQKWNIGSEN